MYIKGQVQDCLLEHYLKYWKTRNLHIFSQEINYRIGHYTEVKMNELDLYIAT